MFAPIAGKGLSTIAMSLLDKIFISFLDFLAGGIPLPVFVVGGQGNLKSSGDGVGTIAIPFDGESLHGLARENLLLLLIGLLEGLWSWRLGLAMDRYLPQFVFVIDCWHWHLPKIQDSAVAAIISWRIEAVEVLTHT